MEYSPRLPQDIKSLRSCPENQMKMLLKISSWNQMSLHNISRSSDFFSTVLPIFNGGNMGCIVHDLETIIVLVLHSISSHKGHTSHYPCYSATVTILPGDDTAAIKAWSLLQQISLFARMEKQRFQDKQ